MPLRKHGHQYAARLSRPVLLQAALLLTASQSSGRNLSPLALLRLHLLSVRFEKRLRTSCLWWEEDEGAGLAAGSGTTLPQPPKQASESA